MSKAAFPVNDLLRRKLQTGLTVATLTLSVANTLFLVQFIRRISWDIPTTGEALTYGISSILSQFLLFIGVLIFAVGAVLSSFIVFLIMKQRTCDFGLIKAAGCPNGLVFGYFMTELIIITFLACVLGVVIGFTADFAVANVLNFQMQSATPDFWLAAIVFVSFFVLVLMFGAKPMLDASRASPIKALSPAEYFGLTTGNKLKPLSRTGLTLKIASRSLFRRQSASVRIIILLSIVFVLLTVSISGSIIANDTSISWVKNAIGTNVVAVAHEDMIVQYTQLLTKFSGAKENLDFNYLDAELGVPDTLIQRLETLKSVKTIDPRLILKSQVQEISTFTIDPETLATIPVGDSREGNSLVIGVNPPKVITSWSLKGRFLNAEATDEAVIGDSISQMMYTPDPQAKIHRSDPLSQGIRLRNASFSIVGVCVDPLNNGKVTYVSIEKLQGLGLSNINILLIELKSGADKSTALTQIEAEVNGENSIFSVLELDAALQKNLNFLGSIWSTIMLLPLFTLTSAALCLVSYTIISLEEQRQEFGVLRIMGTKPKNVITIVAVQSLLVLISSVAVGISLGVMITLMILIAQPVVTSYTIIVIVGWLITALVIMFILSLWPAVHFAKKPILDIVS